MPLDMPPGNDIDEINSDKETIEITQEPYDLKNNEGDLRNNEDVYDISEVLLSQWPIERLLEAYPIIVSLKNARVGVKTENIVNISIALKNYDFWLSKDQQRKQLDIILIKSLWELNLDADSQLEVIVSKRNWKVTNRDKEFRDALHKIRNNEHWTTRSINISQSIVDRIIPL